MERYPNNTIITLDDFKNSGWLEVLGEAGREDYSSMWQVLSSAARKSTEELRLSEGKVFWLLADACSMMLKPTSLNEPFSPFMVMEGKRSALPEDFQDSDVTFFTEIISEINDPKLCARISDISWLLAKPKDPSHALSAIDCYRKIPVNTESWIRDGRECWDRAIQLCLMLRAGAGERLKEIEIELISSVKEATFEDGYLALWLSDLLKNHKLAGMEQVVISQKLEELAINFESSGDLHRSKDYFDIASDWFKKSGDSEKSAEMIVQNAEGWVKEAIARQASNTPSHMVAASFYESAIQKYRTIPKALREIYGVDNRILELRKEMNEAGEHSLGEMGVVSSGAIDITDLIENSVKTVQGKTAIDALAALANVYQGARVERVREFSEKMIREHPLQSLFSSTHISQDGRVIAKRPSGNFGADDCNEATVFPEMVKHYTMELGIVIQGQIWPALEVVRQEHRLRENDFYSVTRQSPIVPIGREKLIAKGLFSGYDNDFITSLHILVPQLEHLIRSHLKQAGVKTTNLDINGIENENGLSTLIELPEVSGIFGDDLTFEIRALFCDSFGPNIRNELAHGLLGYDESQSTYSIYAWWLILRIVFNTFWNEKYSSNTDSIAE